MGAFGANVIIHFPIIKYFFLFFSFIFFIFLFNSGLKLKITSFFFFFYFQLFYSWRATGYCTDFNPYMNGNLFAFVRNEVHILHLG